MERRKKEPRWDCELYRCQVASLGHPRGSLQSQETIDEKTALWDCQCYQFSVPSLICTIPASVITCPISNLVVTVFIACTNAAITRMASVVVAAVGSLECKLGREP